MRIWFFIGMLVVLGFIWVSGWVSALDGTKKVVNGRAEVIERFEKAVE